VNKIGQRARFLLTHPLRQRAQRTAQFVDWP
jgi:hypothetical protein